MNFKLLRLFFFAFFLPLSQSANAQCEYTLQMSNEFGIGWNGSTLIVANGTNVNSFTLSGLPFDDGTDSTVVFTVTNGEPLTLSWVAGFFDFGSSFALYDYDGNLVYEDLAPTTGVLFTGVGACPDCLKPANLKTEDIYDTYAKLRWTPVSLVPSLGWWVIYGPAGFVPGPGVGDSVYVTTPKVTLTGLSKKTNYDWYVLEMCDSTVFPPLVGPVSFQTYWSDDVGISGVVSPVNGCDLGVETVKIVMTNYGANAQSLVPFRYSVNGVDAGVPQPQDGFYTGVLGKDSSEVIEFETTYDFSAPGEYLITVFTEMNGDEDVLNDTFNYYVVNRLVAPYFQDFENWNGGWYVDTASVNATWEFGTPNTLAIPAAASGKNAWVTNLDGFYSNDELSYLHSPCFDFSDLTEDPAIEFSLIYDTELEYDGAWLEISTNEGQNWEKVGAIDEGINWYNFVNDNATLGDVWAGNNGGWQKARFRLLGMAGESNVQFRFAFDSDFSDVYEGVGVDDIRLYVPFVNDLAGERASTEAGDNECGAQDDKVVFEFANIGTEPQSIFTVSYSINGGAPIIELINATVQPYEVFEYTFLTPFDSRNGAFDIKCWTSLSSEQFPVNDTAYFTINNLPKPVPFQEDFEDQSLPTDWTVTGGPVVTNANGNDSYVLEVNMWAANSSIVYDLPLYGTISANDTLSFDYRITNFGSDGTEPTVLFGGTKIDVQVSTDCDAYTTVNSINTFTHTPTINLRTVKIGLGNYAGQNVKIRFRGTWTTGDLNFDLDNINLRACPPDMQLYPTVVPSSNGQNGSATVNVGLGNPPYSYLWDTGDTTQTITGLAIGAYTVTVTDDLGCTDALTINVGAVSTNEIEGLTSLRLQPNPTAGFVQFNADFDRSVDANLQIVNLLGQIVWETNASNTPALSEQIDLGNFPDGLYLVRLSVDGRVVAKKLVKSR